MDYYQEITLIEQSEISLYFIWSKLYGKLHLALVEMKGANKQISIGVSFPQYYYQIDGQQSKVNLGKCLRVFAKTQEHLIQFNIGSYFEHLKDYLHISSIRIVPKDKITGYVIFKRKQLKTNAERLARHRVKTRNDICFEEALKLYQRRITSTDLPFIQMKSSTNRQPFKLFIEKKIGQRTSEYEFSTYGLSSNSTVPEF